MLKAENIPDEVVEAFVDAFHGKDMTRKASIAAALNAWPNVTTTSWFENSVRKAVLNIPLPQEASDE